MLSAQISPEDLQIIKDEVAEDCSALQLKLKGIPYPQEHKQLFIEFSADTFYVEILMDKMMEIDNSTIGIVEALNEGAAGYDKLLNKYYQTLNARLNAHDKETLKLAQRSWLQYRDNEIKLIGLLAREEYSGGGTIQNIFVTANILELTQKRVFELYNYLESIFIFDDRD